MDDFMRDCGRRLTEALRAKGFGAPDGSIDAAKAVAQIEARTGRKIGPRRFLRFCSGTSTPRLDEADDAMQGLGMAFEILVRD
jgi:hypothetical protein